MKCCYTVTASMHTMQETLMLLSCFLHKVLCKSLRLSLSWRTVVRHM